MPNDTRKQKLALIEKGDAAGLSSTIFFSSDDYNRELRGPGAIKVYDKMRKSDATVNAALMAIMLPILQTRWYIKPASDKRADEKVAEFVENNILKGNGMSRTWQETMEEILLYLPYGRYPFEIVYTFDKDNNIVLKKLAPRHPMTILKWTLENGGDGITQQTINGTFEIPMEKLVIFVNKKEGVNWEGISVLRSAYKHWYIKDKLYNIDAVAAERQGLGFPKAIRKAGTSTTDDDAMDEILRNMRASDQGFIKHDEGWDVEFMDMKGTNTRNIMPSVLHHNRQIVLSILAPFLDLGSGNTGSFALSKDQSDMFILTLEGYANYVRDNWNKYVVKKIVDYNFEVEQYPELDHDPIGSIDHNALSTTLQRLVQTEFITPQEEDEEYLRDVLSMPEKSKLTAVDPTLADDMINELNMEMSDLTGEAAPTDHTQDPNADPNADPALQQQQASDEEIEAFILNGHLHEIHAQLGSEAHAEIKQWVGNRVAGAKGQPLSEETKQKISEALKKGIKGQGGKGKGKKPANPEIVKRQAEINKLNKEVKDFTDSARRQLLEMRAKGQKQSPEDAAKMQLELFDKKKTISDKITKLKSEITDIKSKSAAPAAPAKASESVEVALERINAVIDAMESSNK